MSEIFGIIAALRLSMSDVPETFDLADGSVFFFLSMSTSEKRCRKHKARLEGFTIIQTRTEKERNTSKRRADAGAFSSPEEDTEAMYEQLNTDAGANATAPRSPYRL